MQEEIFHTEILALVTTPAGLSLNRIRCEARREARLIGFGTSSPTRRSPRFPDVSKLDAVVAPDTGKILPRPALLIHIKPFA